MLLPIEFILLPHAQMLAVTENLIKTDTSMMHTWQTVSIKIEWMCKDFYFLLPPDAAEEIMMWGITKACYCNSGYASESYLQELTLAGV